MHPSHNSPLVSVIIPTYNRPHFLREALTSVINQTFKDFEVIISDDCSTESPQAVVESFQDSRLRLRHNDTNSGPALAVLRAIEQAKGKYIATLNDDDLWEPNFLAKLVPPLEENSQLAISFCDHAIIDEHGNINTTETEKTTRLWKRDQIKEGSYQPFYKLALKEQSVSPASSAVSRKAYLDWHRLPEAGVIWDYYIAYLACCNGHGAYYYPDRLTRYRVHSQSLTSSSNIKGEKRIRLSEDRLHCFDHILKDQRLSSLHSYFRKRLAFQHTTSAIGYLQVGQQEEARQHLIKASKLNFLSFRTVAALSLSYLPKTISYRFL